MTTVSCFFPAIFSREDNFNDFLFVSSEEKSLSKMGYFYRKEVGLFLTILHSERPKLYNFGLSKCSRVKGNILFCSKY